VWERFPSPVHTGPAAHPSTGSCPVIKRRGRGLDHPPPPSAEVKEKVELYMGPDKSLARPGRKEATATEVFEFHISYL
jgi:hypothetical protein